MIMSHEASSLATEAPYWQDSQGRLVPLEQVKELDRLRTQLVDGLLDEADRLQEKMRIFKNKALSEIAAFVELAACDYSTRVGGAKGNTTLRSFDGLREVRIQITDRLVFDERLKVAEALVAECLSDWVIGARPELKAIIERAFHADKEGQVSTASVLGLLRLNINDERWQRAMQAISDSLLTVGSRNYLRFYRRAQRGSDALPVSLDFSKVC